MAQGQAAACSLLALNDFNTSYCISQLLQSLGRPLVTSPTVLTPCFMKHQPFIASIFELALLARYMEKKTKQ